MKGTTLIELMFALWISTLILSSVIALYLATQPIFQTQAALTSIEENGRVASALLSAEIKRAGYTGCAALRKDYPLACSPVCSFTNTNKIQPFHITEMKAGSTAFTIRYAASKTAILIKSMIIPSLLYVSDEPQFSEGELLQVSDCKQAELFKVKEVRRESNGVQIVLPEQPLHILYNQNAEITQLNINSYYIANTTRVNSKGKIIYGLYRLDSHLHKVELFEGVEDMQIRYSLLDNGQLHERTESEVNDWSKLKGISIRLTLADVNSVLPSQNEYIYAALRNI